jgi:hypothetical protein
VAASRPASPQSAAGENSREGPQDRVQGEDQFTPEAKAAFASEADGWLLAFAHVNGFTVATHEEYAPEAKKSVKIPNVCVEFDVEYCNTFEMIRAVNEQFVLKTRRRRS